MLSKMEADYFVGVKRTRKLTDFFLDHNTKHSKVFLDGRSSFKYSRLSLSRSRRDPLKHFEISVLRHIRFADLRKIPVEQPNFTNEHII